MFLQKEARNISCFFYRKRHGIFHVCFLQKEAHEEEAVDPLATTKPFVCDECSMKFPTSHSLQLHLSICRFTVKNGS
jgi:hypothetical protein